MKKYFIIVVVLVFGAIKGTYAQSEKFQALFIYNFTRYIEWPANGSQDFVIGVVGRSSVYDELVAIANGKRVGSQSIVVKHFANAGEVSSCQILFVSSEVSPKVAEIAPGLQSKNTLIITDRPGLTAKGSGINFVVDDGKQKFELSRNNIQKSGLKVNTQLTDMAMLTD